MFFQMAKRLLFETDKRLLWKLAWNMGFKGMLSVQKHKSRLRRGQVFPPFLYVSVINSCNLRCQGCWVDVAHKQEIIQPAAFRKLIAEARAMGNVFFGIVGGEPFMHPKLFELLEPGGMSPVFHVYRPMGADACPDLSLTPEQQLRARRFVVEMRAKKPIIIIDAYFDGEGQALCPAATGMTHHINPWGDIEPCPIVQFTKESIHSSDSDNRSLKDKFLQSSFLRDFRH